MVELACLSRRHGLSERADVARRRKASGRLSGAVGGRIVLTFGHGAASIVLSRFNAVATTKHYDPW